MNTRKIAAMALILMISRFGFADASYETSSQMTGGTMVDTLKSIPFLKKSLNPMTAPSSTITMVHGNQKAVVNKNTTVIFDLDKETITRIDNVKKTYTVQTFAEIRQAITNMPKQIQNAQAQAQAEIKAQGQAMPQMPSNLKTTFDVNVKNTGATKVIGGLTAQEQVVTMEMHATNTDAPAGQGNTITYQIVTDSWIAPDPPEMKQFRDFDLRMGQKMMGGMDASAFVASLTKGFNNSGLTQLLGSHPGASEALTQMVKEEEKLKGTHLMDVMTFGGNTNGPGGSDSETSTPADASPPGTTPVEVPGIEPAEVPGTTPVGPGEATTNSAPPTANGQPAQGGGLASILGRSGLGGWRKKQTAPTQDTSPQPGNPNVTTNAQGGVSTIMMQTTTITSNFSSEAIPSSVFQVPAGFTKVASDISALNK